MFGKTKSLENVVTRLNALEIKMQFKTSKLNYGLGELTIDELHLIKKHREKCKNQNTTHLSKDTTLNQGQN